MSSAPLVKTMYCYSYSKRVLQVIAKSLLEASPLTITLFRGPNNFIFLLVSSDLWATPHKHENMPCHFDKENRFPNGSKPHLKSVPGSFYNIRELKYLLYFFHPTGFFYNFPTSNFDVWWLFGWVLKSTFLERFSYA